MGELEKFISQTTKYKFSFFFVRCNNVMHTILCRTVSERSTSARLFGAATFKVRYTSIRFQPWGGGGGVVSSVVNHAWFDK